MQGERYSLRNLQQLWADVSDGIISTRLSRHGFKKTRCHERGCDLFTAHAPHELGHLFPVTKHCPDKYVTIRCL